MARHVFRTLPLSTPLARARSWLGLLAFVLPVAAVALATVVAVRAEPLLARNGSLAVLTLVAVSSGLVWWWLDRRIRRVAARIDGDRLCIDCGIGRGDFALADLATHGLEQIDFPRMPAYRPVLRTWGIGLPGLSSGWFRLRNGDKALCILTDRRKPVMLRATAGTRILLSLADPRPLREALEESLRP